MIERTPDDDGEWRPHPKSFPIKHLAQLCAMMPSWIPMMIHQDEIDIAPVERTGPGYSIEPTAALLAMFDKNVADARAALAGVSDAKLAEQWTMKARGQVVSVGTRYEQMRTGVLNHLVHHRAQLGVYLRLRETPVPMMYGPTADEKFG